MIALHTPGPWVFDDAGEVLTAAGGTVIFEGCKNWGSSDDTYDESVDNARLIAAAPALLAALERANQLLAELNFSDWIPKNDTGSIDLRQRITWAHQSAYAAIAQATVVAE